MSQPPQSDTKPAGKPVGKLLQSGVIFSAASFLTNLGNFAFLMLIGWRLGQNGEFSLANNAVIFAGFFAAGVHRFHRRHTLFARFHFSGDDARLAGLFAGCRRFLFG